MHTIGESEHFCTDTIRKLVCSFDNFIPNLGMFVRSIPFSFFVWPIGFLEMIGPEEALKTAVDISD